MHETDLRASAKISRRVSERTPTRLPGTPRSPNRTARKAYRVEVGSPPAETARRLAARLRTIDPMPHGLLPDAAPTGTALPTDPQAVTDMDEYASGRFFTDLPKAQPRTDELPLNGAVVDFS